MSEFVFESVGIARLINQHRLMVPSNQRPYAWEDEHVTSLLDDIHEAIADQQEDYFLGTVVLVGSGGALSIAAEDGTGTL